MEAVRSNWKERANNNIYVEDGLDGFDENDKLLKSIISLWLIQLHPQTSLLGTRYKICIFF